VVRGFSRDDKELDNRALAADASAALGLLAIYQMDSFSVRRSYGSTELAREEYHKFLGSRYRRVHRSAPQSHDPSCDCLGAWSDRLQDLQRRSVLGPLTLEDLRQDLCAVTKNAGRIEPKKSASIPAGCHDYFPTRAQDRPMPCPVSRRPRQMGIRPLTGRC
jgi:hypothetical protein